MFAIMMELFWKMGFNKKSILYAIYLSLPPIISAVTIIIIIVYGKFKPATALTLSGLGTLISDSFSN
jgi:hypothetical protein